MPIVEATAVASVRGARGKLIEKAMAEAVQESYAEASEIAARDDLTAEEKAVKTQNILSDDKLRARVLAARARVKGALR